jgi:endonuclease/exonuclease/phosphatase family metal-dependent hydrolase
LITKEITIEPASGDCLPETIPQFQPLSALKQLGKKMLRLPGLRNLRPGVRRAFSVAEPAGRLSVRVSPVPGDQGSPGIAVISANLCHDWPRYRRIAERLEDFARLVEENGAEIVLLQEVARTPQLLVDQWLAERLNMGYVYSRANGHHRGIGFEEGLAIFSRYPIGQPYLKKLGCSKNPFVRRLALGAQIQTPYGPILAFSVHLGLAPKQNRLQFTHLKDWVAEAAQDAPALIGGDFNAPETRRHMREARSSWLDIFRAHNPEADGFTHEISLPWGKVMRKARLDYLFLKPGKEDWRVLDAQHLFPPRRKHSDHRAVYARLTLNI